MITGENVPSFSPADVLSTKPKLSAKGNMNIHVTLYLSHQRMKLFKQYSLSKANLLRHIQYTITSTIILISIKEKQNFQKQKVSRIKWLCKRHVPIFKYH
jgi:hypothetical protein